MKSSSDSLATHHHEVQFHHFKWQLVVLSSPKTHQIDLRMISCMQYIYCNALCFVFLFSSWELVEPDNAMVYPYVEFEKGLPLKVKKLRNA